MSPRRVSLRLAARQRAGGAIAVCPSVLTDQKSRGLSKRQQQLVMEAASQPRLFPMIDDMVAGVVLTYLPSEELGIR